MRRASLAAKLGIAFAAITLTVFGIVGSILYRAFEHQIQAQDDVDLMLTARHFRRLANEILTTTGIYEHATRLDTLVLGTPALLMQVFDRDGHLLIEHNPEHIRVVRISPVGPEAKITASDIHEWRDARGMPVRGVATQATLYDGTLVQLVLARDMSDRVMLYRHYRTTIAVGILCGTVAALVLGLLLIRTALRPVRAIAQSAADVTVHRLDTRIDAARVPPELDALVQSLNAMLARLESGFQRLSHFTADLAHDLRTPISNMRGASEVALARRRTPDEYQALIASNLEECERVSRMIENVLFLARAEHPNFVTTATEFAVCDELARIAEYFEGLADDAGVSVELNASGRLTADVELFRRAVSNLLANALRYTPRGGAISIRAGDEGGGMHVVIANPGAPIPPEHLDKLFDRFYRVDPSRSNPSGSTGLGLAIVRTIMELHGGRAWVASDSGSTRFHLQFMRA
jgi:two-component system, OmpR family, heavy metal sensor histidine kinase CusS